MSIDTAWREHLRLVVLRVLAEAPSSTANDSLLTDVIGSYGLTATRAQMRTELAWLDEQGLIETESLAGLIVVSITERGSEVASGLARVPGVKKPSPRSRA
jgi:repressor of nif and glnA expression